MESKFSIIKQELSRLSKISMAVPLPENIKSQMAQEGIFALLEKNPALPNMGVKEIRERINNLRSSGAVEFLNNVDPDTALLLPYIYKPSERNLVEVDGREYYAVSVTDPEPAREAKKRQNVRGIEYQKGQTIPGTTGEIILMDVATGNPQTFAYTEVASKIRRPAIIRQRTLQTINKEIELWNEKVAAIEKSTGATRLNLQVAAAEDRIKSRIAELSGQEQNLQNSVSRPENISQAYMAWMSYLQDHYQEFSPRDMFDTLLFLNQSNPQELLSRIESNEINVPEEVKNALVDIATQEVLKKQEKETKERTKQQQETERRQEELMEGKEPIETTLTPLTEEDIPEQPYEVPNKYKTLHTWTASLNRAIEGIRKDREDMQNILSTFGGLRRYIAGIEKSDRFLSSPEGASVIQELRNFLDAAQVFIKRYNVDVIENGKVNSRLLGRSGTPGNALIAVRLNNIYSIVLNNIREIEGEPLTEQERTAPEEVEQREPVANAQDKIKRMSELLWMAFENRMKIK